MSTFLLIWNPKRYEWEDFPEALVSLREYGNLQDRWSCGNTKRIHRGARFFLIRLGQKPRGIVASGTILSEPFERPHWDLSAPAGRVARYVDVQFDALLDVENEPILEYATLSHHPILSRMHWSSQVSGIQIPDEVAVELEKIWSDFLGTTMLPFPEELSSTEVFHEGLARTVTVNRYERSPSARQKCIDHYGARCFVCGFVFPEVYGPVGEGMIHVHHLRPLGEQREQVDVDPIRDMRPVCPNCHAIIHRKTPAYSIEEVQALIRVQKES